MILVWQCMLGLLKFRCRNAAVARTDFDMEKEGYTNQGVQAWMAVADANTSEWARYDRTLLIAKRLTDVNSIYESGKCSDFTIIAGATLFPVHRVL